MRRVYKTYYKFNRYSIRKANKLFADECERGLWVKEDIADYIGKDEADKIIDFAWCMADRDCGCIRVMATEKELSDETLEALSKWAKNQCDSQDIFNFTDASLL